MAQVSQGGLALGHQDFKTQLAAAVASGLPPNTSTIYDGQRRAEFTVTPIDCPTRYSTLDLGCLGCGLTFVPASLCTSNVLPGPPTQSGCLQV